MKLCCTGIGLGVFSLLVFFFALQTPAGDAPSGSIPVERFHPIDPVMEHALARGDLPGAVVLVEHRGRTVFRKAYGLRSKQPAEKPMTVDTIFDLASLTKPIATATSIMILIEQGKLHPADRVARYLASFGQNGKAEVTIEQLLLHTSGFVADNPVSDYRDGRQRAFERIDQLAPVAPPGSRFIYSDLNYIVAGEVVEKLSGQSLGRFAADHIFKPLGMKDTGFRPLQSGSGPESLHERLAPTEERDGRWLVGEVHDPRSFLLGGVAGHAGLFSTADDLAVYAQMILGGGTHRGQRILSPLGVRLMTTPRPVPGGLRAYGWDVQTSFSSNRGELFPRGESFGHTGFTGTSIWIDPGSQTAVIFLSNRVHPKAKTNINGLRGQVATIAAAAVDLAPDVVGHSVLPVARPECSKGVALPGGAATPFEDSGRATRGSEIQYGQNLAFPAGPQLNHARTQVLTGIDVLERENFRRLKGQRIGLVTNHSGLDCAGRSTIDLLHHAEGVQLVALFSPEHGIRGTVEERVADTVDARTGLPIYSLYGARRKPDRRTLEGLDTLLYDIQDAGCRFYTYITTLGYLLEAAGESKQWRKSPLRVMVLDRPNPLGGLAVQGPLLDPGRESFTAFHRLPVRHGMTVGELALFYNSERHLGADLEVVRMEGWKRGQLYDQTGLYWVNPSPNLRSLSEALLYPGIGMLETTNVSVGRGTDRPFEWIGAPWIDGRELADLLAAQRLRGVRCLPLRLTPSASTCKGQECGGIQFLIEDWRAFQPLATSLAVAWALHHLYPERWQLERYGQLLAHRATLDGLAHNRDWKSLAADWHREEEQFKKLRQPYLLYEN
jgi:uncharacterized protein YbbC (DUF1343 family)/CubicO group peptidase (beta-lactamase class C family)